MKRDNQVSRFNFQVDDPLLGEVRHPPHSVHREQCHMISRVSIDT